MKILCVIDSIGSGGAQRQLVELAKGFKELGHKVQFLTYFYDTFYESFLKENEIPIHCVNEQNYLKRIWRMRYFIRRGNYDIVLSFLEATNFICEISSFPKRRWKLIVGERSANPQIKNSIRLILFRYFHFFADYIVANSYENIKLVKKVNPFISENKFRVIYNLIDFQKFDSIKAEPKIKSNKLRLIIPASYRNLKNLDGMIEAVNLLDAKDREKIVIEWYGNKIDDSREKGIEKVNKYKLNDVIKFYSATHDIIRIIKSADGVGLFSFFEGFPNAVCEGMAASKVVLSSNVSDVPYFFNDAPILLFDPNKIDEIRNVLSSFIHLSEAERQKIEKLNRMNAERYFKKDTIINQYIKLFNK